MAWVCTFYLKTAAAVPDPRRFLFRFRAPAAPRSSPGACAGASGSAAPVPACPGASQSGACSKTNPGGVGVIGKGRNRIVNVLCPLSAFPALCECNLNFFFFLPVSKNTFLTLFLFTVGWCCMHMFMHRDRTSLKKHKLESSRRCISEKLQKPHLGVGGSLDSASGTFVPQFLRV